ncbi:hypothetical protein E1B28_003481 [Marasmius oreades]|uniref:RING-type domain-containing protein n=1 Tax=Marasmius oreades TaxID=181124 RepID=A0A9P7UKN5_9AGAR|nr:uncharacterized protein E1B28_003481 [Marasmius oreades]KAG7085953.1 hypothetical protein E1B28_003481 [Marasmius oreades]
MKDTTSSHIVSLRSLTASNHWGTSTTYRPALNLRKVAHLIRQYHDDTDDASVPEPETTGKGKKRARSPSSDETCDRKRLKTISGVSATHDGPNQNNPYPIPFMKYPLFSGWKPTSPVRSSPDGPIHSVPVFHHVFDIQFSNIVAEDVTAAQPLTDDWLAEEEWFAKELDKQFGTVSEPLFLELGDVYFSKYRNWTLVLSENGGEPEEGEACFEWLSLLPAYNPDNIDANEYELSSPEIEELLPAILVLQQNDRAHITGFAKLAILPHKEIPFSLQIDLTVSLLTPTIFKSPTVSYKVQRTLIEDTQRRFLHFLYPPSPPPSSFKGCNNVAFYYSVMRPAPELLTKDAEAAMQPDGLLSTVLLPFQRRTVGWMLEREGMDVLEDGRIQPSETPKDFDFWYRAEEEGGHVWYFNRLTRMISEERPRRCPAYGGILAEEPGLGKTVETIALISLNPAPSDRQPSMMRWDPESQVAVKAIKSTLIVTPQALQSQWIDELKAHAPHLKVLVYDGWLKINLPVTSTQIEKAKEIMAQTKRKVEKKAARPATKAAATAKIKGKGKRGTSNEENAAPGPSDQDVEEEVLDWYTYAHSFDVVITTYNVLQSDLNVARLPPARPRRTGVSYANIERQRSPLVMCEWYRVIMDEVQMAGGGKIEDMVSLIPRRTSFAVSGTPARTQVADLIHVLRFLRVSDYIGPQRLWNRLLRPGYAGEFADFFGHYSVRTVKKAVSEELTIPQQTRYLVSIEMGRVERHVYDQALEMSLAELGLDARGVAASQGWDVDGAILRQAIRRLRAICTHPQVGQLVKPNDKQHKNGTLKSMADVLETMKDQNWRILMEDVKSKIQVRIKIAQLQMLDAAARNRYQVVVETLQVAEQETKKLIEDIELALTQHRAQGEILKNEAAAQRELRAQARSDQGDKDKQRAVSPLISDDEDDDDDDDDHDEDEGDKALPRTEAGKEYKAKRSTFKSRLREARFVLHRVKLLQGDAYHNLGPLHSDQENAAYAAAEQIRRTLLKTTEMGAKKGMQQLALDATSTGVNEQELLIPVPFFEQGGIRSAEMIEELHEIIENVLNEQSTLLWEWRTEIYKLLTQRLNGDGGDDDDADGQEYERNLNNQGEAETYMQAYSALLADRRQALMNERTLLAAHDVREKKSRNTKAAQNALASAETLDLPEDALEEMRPQDQVLLKQLSDQRKELLMDLDGRAVKTIMVQLSGALGRITKDDDPEKVLLKQTITEVRRLIQSQQSMMDKLDADLSLFRKAFNHRVLYFRQLQEISDSVAEVEFEGSRLDALHNAQDDVTILDGKINTNRARQRYLENLASLGGQDDEEDERCCILCRCEFERGFITPCAHVFCEGCLKAWTRRKEGKTCPVCRVPIDADTLQRFTLNGPENPPQKVLNENPRQKIVNGEMVPRSRRQITYNMIDPKLFKKIQKIDAFGDFGNKIQSLVRHLLYLQQNDPGSKSIVFSAWADSLTIVQQALIQNGIQSIRIDRGVRGEGPVKRFKTNPEILVLLLHGERENAGLNITCASRVFLLESVVHHGFEVQAIARIDRMGQTRPTEVYCYYAEDTVERNILDLAVRQGLSLYTKENARGSLNSSFTNNMEKQVVEGAPAYKKGASRSAAKSQKGDFISKIDDMLAVLFPHMYEDAEYLIESEPADQDVVMEDMTNVDFELQSRRSMIMTMNKSTGSVNAIAGPSKVRA